MAKLRASIERVRVEASKSEPLNKYEEPSFQYGWKIDNCAEVWSTRYDNFIVRTESLLGGFAKPCENCRRAFLDFYNIDN